MDGSGGHSISRHAIEGHAIGTFFGIWTLAFAIEMGLLMSPAEALKKKPVFGTLMAIVVVAAAWLYLALNAHGWESNRLLAIGIGGGLGWFMLLNVWGIVWRMQKKLIRWTEAAAERHTDAARSSKTGASGPTGSSDKFRFVVSHAADDGRCQPLSYLQIVKRIFTGLWDRRFRTLRLKVLTQLCSRLTGAENKLQWQPRRRSVPAEGDVDAINKTAGILNAVQDNICALDFKSIKVIAGGGYLGRPVLGEEIVVPSDECQFAITLENPGQPHAQFSIRCFLQGEQLGSG